VKRKENTLLPGQFYSLKPSSPEGFLGRHQERHGQFSQQPQTQESTQLCRSLFNREAKGWLETASLLTTTKVQPEIVASQAPEDLRFWSEILLNGSPLL